MPFIQESNFKGNKWLRGGHSETIVPALLRNVKVDYQRERFFLMDGDFLDLDWIKTNQPRLLVLFHGLEGSSNSTYIKGFAQFFQQLGWDVCAVNFRSCSGEMNNLKRSYHSGATEDIHEVLQFISTHTPYAQMVLGGFSLGGNMLLKYLGEQKYPIPVVVSAAFAFSVPMDLAGSAFKMANWENKLYMNRFLKSLRKKMRSKATLFPNDVSLKGINGIRTFVQFDNIYTGPMHGFKDALDYYNQNNSLQFLAGIGIPTLLVNAHNDPFLNKTCYPKDIATNHPFLTLEIPKFGGHVGFCEDLPNGNYWSEKRVVQFLNENSILN